MRCLIIFKNSSVPNSHVIHKKLQVLEKKLHFNQWFSKPKGETEEDSILQRSSTFHHLPSSFNFLRLFLYSFMIRKLIIEFLLRLIHFLYIYLFLSYPFFNLLYCHIFRVGNESLSAKTFNIYQTQQYTRVINSLLNAVSRRRTYGVSISYFKYWSTHQD